jgi:hypothetical protein
MQCRDLFTSPESHHRQVVDYSSPTYKRVATSLNPTSGSWWIVQARPKTGCHFFESHQRKLVDRSSPTYRTGNPRRLGLNNPPASAGGIRESIFALIGWV